MATDAAFWRNKRVLLTGHTGFKGSWASLWLMEMGAQVTGLALPPATDPNLHGMIGGLDMTSILSDMRSADAVRDAVARAAPQIVLHMAAQPLVRYSYRHPTETFETNVMGTVNLLDALRCHAPDARILVITTDKVYRNDETGRPFREDDHLGGYDPYAASKAATEIAVESFRRSYFASPGQRLTTARGGNVIGGGDFSEDRLIPDIIRAMRAGRPVELRNPGATRPWQHVLDCLDGYFTLVQAETDVPPAVNIGPHDPEDTQTVAQVTAAMARALGINDAWTEDTGQNPHEMAALALDPSLAQSALGWRGRLSSVQAIRLTADWYAAWANGADMSGFTRAQIAAYQAAEETAP